MHFVLDDTNDAERSANWQGATHAEKNIDEIVAATFAEEKAIDGGGRVECGTGRCVADRITTGVSLGAGALQ